MDREQAPKYADLRGRVGLVTGAGSGIGRATACALAANGVCVAITELPGRAELAESAVEAIQAAGGRALALALDIRQTYLINEAIHRVVDDFGGLDILVNNAGAQLLKPAVSIEEEEFDDILSVNLRGAFFCAQAASVPMFAAKNGAIINVASHHGVVGNFNRAAYIASKGGLISLTRALAVEWAAHGVRVNAVSPTYTANETNAHLLECDETQCEIRRRIPLQRAATAAEIADSVCFLASSAASMITGHNLLVDGGWTAA
jgi:NAD(P)-dependent dehydrogenase (short-subunit alcohol dehydrogenase family)